MLTAVVGHVEWVTFARVPRLLQAGEIVHADAHWDEVGGGGAVAAGQLRKLSDATAFFTALGDDHIGKQSEGALRGLGIDVQVAYRDGPTRRALTHIDPSGERTITVLGDRAAPLGADPLPWDRLDGAAAVYFTAGDVAALRHARRAGVLVATARVLDVLHEAEVQLDALVASSADEFERYEPGMLDPAPRLVVLTAGSSGGTYFVGDERFTYSAVPPPGPIADRYGAGDSFAAGLTHALGAGMAPPDAVACAARCGAHAVTGWGPYEGQYGTLPSGA